MIRLEIRNYNIILTEKQQKYQHYPQVKLINMNFLQGEEMLSSNQRQLIKQAKLTYSPLEKALKGNKND